MYKSYTCIKKYKEVHKQDPQIKVLLGNLLHLNIVITMKSGMKTWTIMKLNKHYHSMLILYLQIKEMEEQAFVIEVICQTRMQNIIECNIPPMMVINNET
jgi:hypothetical protein